MRLGHHAVCVCVSVCRQTSRVSCLLIHSCVFSAALSMRGKRKCFHGFSALTPPYPPLLVSAPSADWKHTWHLDKVKSVSEGWVRLFIFLSADKANSHWIFLYWLTLERNADLNDFLTPEGWKFTETQKKLSKVQKNNKKKNRLVCTFWFD